jgi:8-amino-7-oxononanoate synthase
MPDFTSALYLGMHHASDELKPWRQLTSGVPLALSVSAVQQRVESALAKLLGCKMAVLGTSTLHLFWDLFGLLAGRGSVILVDRGAYPISRWGVERALARGARVETFSHHDAHALALASKRYSGRPILVVSDGFCTGCGSPAPVADYLSVVKSCEGLLVLDDTQGLGVLGQGGGGVVAGLSRSTESLLVVSSLAKGFGVPLAMLAGSHALTKEFVDQSETRVHCSPPSSVHVQAAAHALDLNQRQGERLRRHLRSLIRTFRSWLGQLGWRSVGGLFPVQSLVFQSPEKARQLYRKLQQWDVHTVLRHIRCSGHVAVSFVLNARHTIRELEIVLSRLARFLPNSSVNFMESPNEHLIF